MANFRAYRVEHMVRPSEGDMVRAVSDILKPTGGWSWTGKRPTVRVRLRGGRPVHYKFDFTIADATFKQTGPINVTFFVNDHTLQTVHYAMPGPQLFEQLVPAEWIDPKNEILVAAEIDKLWISPDDGTKLGLILTRMGLTEE
jgi:hypothetical protein